jgi:glucose/arabinose dehydrogenase
MQTQHWCRTLLSAIAVLTASCLISSLVPAQNQANSGQDAKSQACPNDDTGLKLPDGFCATVFADGIGHARHVVVAPNGVVYTNTWSGEYYDNTPVHPGGFLVALQDKSGAGKADVIERFGETIQTESGR